MCNKKQYENWCVTGVVSTVYLTGWVLILGVCILVGKFVLTPSIDASTPIQPTGFDYYSKTNSSQVLSREDVANLSVIPSSVYFYIHGFESPDLTSANSIKIKDALLEVKKATNLVVLVDWCEESSRGVNTFLDVATFTVPKIAEHVRDEILWIEANLRIPRSHIRMAGHGLGAHIMGRSGELLQSDGGGRVDKMTGLDPTGPLFDDVFPAEDHRLSKSDADRVLCIHTDDAMGTTNRTFCHDHLYPDEETCKRFGCGCKHNSAKVVFVNYLRKCPGLRDKEPEIGCDDRFVRSLLRGGLRNLAIPCMYSTGLAVVYVTWVMVCVGAICSTITCCLCPYTCLHVYMCINKTDGEKVDQDGDVPMKDLPEPETNPV